MTHTFQLNRLSGIAVCFSIYEIKELFVICRSCGSYT